MSIANDSETSNSVIQAMLASFAEALEFIFVASPPCEKVIIVLDTNHIASAMKTSQALHGLAPKCKLINMHELINKSTNDYVTLLPCKNGANVNNKG